VSDTAAREILVSGARALAHADGPGPGLEILVAAVAGQLGAESAAIVAVRDGSLEIAASFGLEEPALAALAAAVADPGHPIARTVAAPAATFDVLPTRPGGPALRSHLPLTVTRDGTEVVLGVLAIAHERPIDPENRALAQAGADLAAVALERRVS
jgi:GAF domain-containing protein